MVEAATKTTARQLDLLLGAGARLIVDEVEKRSFSSEMLPSCSGTYLCTIRRAC